MKCRISKYLAAFFFAVAAAGLEAMAVTPEVVELKHPVEMLKYHLRLRPSKIRASMCELIWNRRGDSCRVLRVDIPAIVSCDELTGFESRWMLVERVGECDIIVSEGKFRSHYASGDGCGFSLILNADTEGGTICLGGDVMAVAVPVDFDSASPGGIGYACKEKLPELENRIWFRELPDLERSRFSSEEELREYLSVSRNPYEGIWEFMDRENDPAKAVPGATYILATVADGRGGYEIVNLTDAGMFLKGRMRPTKFAANFDLTWCDANGRDAGPECYAAFEIQNLALRFNFPLLGASMRFRRMDITPVQQ